MTVKDYAMLHFVDVKNNNNKFYELTLNEDDSILTRWGRVAPDVAGQTKVCYGGLGEFNRIINAKIAKGYERTKAVSVSKPQSTSKMQLAEAAKRDMLGNVDDSSVIAKLVVKLTEMNRHQIYKASSGNIVVNDDGLVKTALGMVTLDTITEARHILDKVETFVARNKFSTNQYIDLLTNYIKLIPQKVPSRGGWHENFFTEFSSLTEQNSFLDQLEGSIDLYKSKEDQMRKQMSQDNSIKEKLFSTRLEIVDDPAVIRKIEKFYSENRNNRHVSSHLKLKNVFQLYNDEQEELFNKVSKKVGNVKMLWHGTRVFNVLSILKNGLIIPRSGGSYQITGRMFGDGLYFSDQSTKSLNYSYGYWDHGSKDNNCFMFLADVAMGKEYTPSSYNSSSFPVKGYDSVFAKAGASGVQNNEMIVYDISQARLRYLCEFSDK